MGMGGGIILLSVIASVVETSYIVPLHAAVQLISNTTRLALFFKHIRWHIILYFVSGLGPGVILGIFIFKVLPNDIVKLMMGIFILLVTFLPKSKREIHAGFSIFIPVGFVSGVIGIFFGAIGPFIAPFFIRKDIIKEELIATKATCQSITHLLKIPLFGLIGSNIFDQWEVLVYLSLAVVAGTFIGKKLLKKLSDRIFIISFKIILTLIALRIIIIQISKIVI